MIPRICYSCESTGQLMLSFSTRCPGLKFHEMYVPFGARSCGQAVLRLERSRVQVTSMLLQFRDVGSSFCTFVLVQTWLTVFTILVSICSISFFTYGGLPAPHPSHVPLQAHRSQCTATAANSLDVANRCRQ